MDDQAAPLREAWYYAAPSRQIGRSAMLAKVMLGEPVLIGRDAAGAVFALRGGEWVNLRPHHPPATPTPDDLYSVERSP